MPSPLPDPVRPFAEQDLITLVAMALWGEARGCTERGKLGVGCVIANRVASGKYGSGFAGVILKPWQFSCFNASDPNRGKLLQPLKYDKPEVWEECYQCAAEIVHAKAEDVVNGAVFYFSRPLTAPPHAWGNVTPTVVIDGLHFYKEA